MKLFFFISNNKLKIFYIQNGKKIKQFLYKRDENIPLCFFSTENEFQIGTSALLKHNAGYDFTYNMYFDLIKDEDLEFLYLDNKKHPVKDLFKFGIEHILHDFLIEELNVSDKLDDYKKNLDLYIIGNQDVNYFNLNEISKLFSGFKTINSLLLDNIILKQQFKNINKRFKDYLCVTTINTNLLISHYSSIDDSNPENIFIGNKIAVNPKLKLIADLLYSDTVQKFGVTVKKEEVLPELLKIAQENINITDYEYRIPTQLTKGGPINNVLINTAVLDHKLSKISNNSDDFDFLNYQISYLKLQKVDLGIIFYGNIHSDLFLKQLQNQFNVTLIPKIDYNLLIKFILDNELKSSSEKKNLIKEKSEKVNNGNSREIINGVISEKKITNKKSIKTGSKTPPPLPNSFIKNNKLKPPPLPKGFLKK